MAKEITSSESLHRFMVNACPDIIFIVDSEGKFIFANQRAEQLLGYSLAELLGMHYSTLVDPDDLERAAYCFGDRRVGDRASRSQLLKLLTKYASDNNFTSELISKPARDQQDISPVVLDVEVTAMGFYKQEVSGKDAKFREQDFSGTYVFVRDISERIAAEKIIHYQATHDMLTGLANRALFVEQLNGEIKQATLSDNQVAVIFINLDRFKTVNDTYGHTLGDTLIKQVAYRIAGCLSKDDLLARLGGDEFLIYIPAVTHIEEVKTIAETVIQKVSEVFLFEQAELFLTASAGMSIFPLDSSTANGLIKNAEIAMYAAKEQGRSNSLVFHQDMLSRQNQLLTIERHIKSGLKERQFEIYYQPQFSFKDGTVCGVEALLRWQHPEKGLLSPESFLTIAEDTGLIIELGDWALHTALREVSRWDQGKTGQIRLAVNCSVKQIEQPDFVTKIITALHYHNFSPALFEIEVTESTLINNLEDTIEKFRLLRKAGINIALDDFGTGYSSLSLLQNLPINRIKIDRSFIHELQDGSDRSIIEAIAHIARGLNLEIVAEGVEYEYQLLYLQKLQCDVIQGYLYSSGLPDAEALALIQNVKTASQVQKEPLATGHNTTLAQWLIFNPGNP